LILVKHILILQEEGYTDCFIRTILYVVKCWVIYSDISYKHVGIWSVYQLVIQL